MRNVAANRERDHIFDLRSTDKAPEVKVYRGQAPILAQMSFFNNFLPISSSATILLPLCFSRRGESNDTQFNLKRSSSKFDLRSEVRSHQSRLCCI